MNTLTINSKAALTLARAADKARSEKPVVQKTAEYGVYTVLTHNRTKKYTVRCNSATKAITCNCPASKPCYHIAAVAPIHSYIARQLRDQAARDLAAAEIETANWPLPGQAHIVPSFFANKEEAERVATAAAPAEDPAILYADLVPSFINESPAIITCMNCGEEANVFLTGGDRLCWDHLKERAEAEAEKDEVREMLNNTPAPEAKCITRRCPNLADAGCNGFCADCYRDEIQAAKDNEDLFGVSAPSNLSRFQQLHSSRSKEAW